MTAGIGLYKVLGFREAVCPWAFSACILAAKPKPGSLLPQATKKGPLKLNLLLLYNCSYTELYYSQPRSHHTGNWASRESWLTLNEEA